GRRPDGLHRRQCRRAAAGAPPHRPSQAVPGAFGQRARDHRRIVLLAAHAYPGRFAAQQPLEPLRGARQPAGTALARRADPVGPGRPGGAGGRLRPRHHRPDREGRVELQPGQAGGRCLQRHPLNRDGLPRMKPRRIRTTLLAVAMAGAVPGAVQAVRVDYSIDAGLERDDNVALTAQDQVEQTISRVGFGFELEQESSVVQASMVGRIDHRRYEEEFGNTTDRMFLGRLNWTMLPDRLSLVVEDSYGVQT